MTAADAGKIDLYQSMLETDPDNVLIALNLYDLYHRAGELEKAADGFLELVEHETHGSVARSNLAKVRLSQQDFESARTLFSELVDEGDFDPALFHNLGITCYYQQDWAAAQQAFERARDGGLTIGNNLRYLAFALHQQDQLEAAYEVVQQWLDSGGADDAAGYMAVLELNLGNREAAQQIAAEALQMDPDNADANYVQSIGFMEQQEMDQAERRLEKVLEKQPESHRALHGLGMVHYYRQQFDEAITYFNRALAVSPRQIGTWLTIGWAYIAKQDFTKAEETFRRAIEVQPSFGESHGGLAASLAFQQRVDEANREITVARRLDANSFGAVYAQSIIVALQGRQDTAAKLIERALKRNLGPGAPNIEDSLKTYILKQADARPAEPDPVSIDTP